MPGRNGLCELRGVCRALSTAQAVRGSGSKRVLGCGSNVVDHVYNVKVVPQAGEKGFFQSPYRALEKKVIGGVTLNHLAWAALGGVPTGLLALQGEDELGHFIRNNLLKLGVATNFIKTGSHLPTAQCHIFIQEGGERSILMAPAATSLINAQAVQDNFDADIRAHASMLTTEISQVPLSGVQALLNSAKTSGVLSILDLDVPPSVAVDEALLGNMNEVVECVRSADVLKPAKTAAKELLSVMTGREEPEDTSLSEVASELVRLCGCQLVALTNGGEASILATPDMVVEVPPPLVETVVDTTGAGDAFLGGLIVGLSSLGGLPQTQDQLRDLCRVANGYGAACVQSVGGVPNEGSRELLRQYLPDSNLLTGGGRLALSSVDSSQTSLTGFYRSIKNDLDAINSIQDRVDRNNIAMFLGALDCCQGQLLLSGIGKSGHVAQRFASSLGSVGISASFVHAAEWIHGDLGRAQAGRDVAVFLSHSGTTQECVIAATRLGERGVATLAVTGGKDSTLSKLCMLSLCYDGGGLQEPFGCMPTTSIILQEVLCNALLCELIQRRGIEKKTFARNHPGGNIGAKLKQKQSV